MHASMDWTVFPGLRRLVHPAPPVPSTLALPLDKEKKERKANKASQCSPNHFFSQLTLPCVPERRFFRETTCRGSPSPSTAFEMPLLRGIPRYIFQSRRDREPVILLIVPLSFRSMGMLPAGTTISRWCCSARAMHGSFRPSVLMTRCRKEVVQQSMLRRVGKAKGNKNNTFLALLFQMCSGAQVMPYIMLY